MYEAFWKLREPPFRNEFRSAFYYATASHQAALLKVRYALQQRLPAVLIAGPSGIGKSFITRLAVESLQEIGTTVETVCLFDDPEGFIADVACMFGESVPEPISGYAALRGLRKFLAEPNQEAQHAVLVLDQVHLIQTNRMWEAVRGLITLDIGGRTPWTVVLSAQPTVLPILERLGHVEELLGLKCLLRPLEPGEIGAYVRHCMEKAGCSEDVFAPEAIERIAEFSGGIPRRINRLCDLSLLVAYAEKSKIVQANHVEAVHEELAGIPTE